MNRLTGEVVLIYYVFNYKKFFKGPLNIVCEIYNYRDGRQINATSVQVFYTIDELYSRGFKWGDYKIVYDKLLTGDLLPVSSGRVFTVSSLD